jgi:predicted XRE-type DNA-binding protein
MQIAGDVKKDTGLKFKAACTLNELTLGEGLEQAILLWLEQDELKKSPLQAKASGDAA